MDGNVYNNEQRAIATIDFKSRKNLDSNSVVIGRDSVAKNGIFTFGSLLIRIEPNSTANITISFQDLNAFGNDVVRKNLAKLKHTALEFQILRGLGNHGASALCTIS